MEHWDVDTSWISLFTLKFSLVALKCFSAGFTHRTVLHTVLIVSQKDRSFMFFKVRHTHLRKLIQGKQSWRQNVSSHTSQSF